MAVSDQLGGVGSGTAVSTSIFQANVCLGEVGSIGGACRRYVWWVEPSWRRSKSEGRGHPASLPSIAALKPLDLTSLDVPLLLLLLLSLLSRMARLD